MKQDKKDSFMKNITLNLKHFVLLFILAMFSVTASAVNITYSITTHTGTPPRTLIGTAIMDAGASLEANMPQALWRGYTTYTYYSNAAKTVEITTAPAEDATVYVDYVFDPPFLMSNDSKTVWNYIRNYVDGGSTQRYLYYNKTDKRVYQQKGTSVTSNHKIQWAFYGDGYDFNIKLNDSSIDNPWLIWGGGNDRLQLGAKQQVGWQIYANAAKTNTRPGGTVCIGRPDNGDLMYMPDLGIALKTQSINTRVHHFDSHHQLVSNYSDSDLTSPATGSRNGLWLYAFFASPTTSAAATPDIWHVTYKIKKAGDDTSWYDDIVVQKTSSNLKPTFPPVGFTPNPNYAYECFYKDAEFTEKYGVNEEMLNDRNTVIYIKEVACEPEPWKTLVLPYSINDLSSFFGGADAVKVLEYYKVDGELNGDAFKCNLHFRPVNEIQAGYPYLFKAERVSQKILADMYNINGSATAQVVTFDDEENENVKDIFVSMKGVLADGGYPMSEDGLNFFFGSVPNGADYDYKFYRVGGSITGISIPKFRCYFFVTDERSPGGAPIRVSFGTESITGVSSVIADVKVNNSIYSLDGRKVNASSLDNLKRGIYIINGRKVVK